MKLQKCLSVFLVCSFACICTDYLMYWFRHVFVCIYIRIKDTSSGGLNASAHLSPPLPDPHITCLLPLTLAILSVFFLNFSMYSTSDPYNLFYFFLLFHILKVETYPTTSALKLTKEKPKAISDSRPSMDLLNTVIVLVFFCYSQ